MEEDLRTAFDVFDELRAMAAEDRLAALARLGAERPRLARTVQEMLRADDDGSEWLLDHAVATVAPDVGPEVVPDRVGPYRVVRELGRGTFGRVFLAERDAPFRQTVALKLLQPFRGSRRTIERFRREMRVLAEMEDPGVARLLDAGVTEEGTPYFATEFIDGPPIDLYCRERGLSPAQRLALIAQVCDAVHHAHQRSIVHRDVKPSNVLVGEVRGESHVRVIDFGIAKLLDPAESEEVTLDGGIVGTPGFMSPEQRAGEAVDARSDVYAIGMLLAVTLTGRRLAPVGAPGGPGERLIAEYAGPRRRDLAHIVHRATHADREQRFPSAAHMGEEIRRVIEGRPLVSRPASPLVALMLYARGHPITAAALVLLIGLAGLLTVRVALTNQKLERLIGSQSELIARTTGIVTRQLGAYTGTAETRAALIDELLRSAEALKARHPRDPSIDVAIAQLLGASGDLAYEAGQFQRARATREEVARRAAGLAAQGALDLERLRWYAEAVVKCGDMEIHSGDLGEALRRYEEALAIQQRIAAAAPEHLGVLDDISWSWDRISATRHRSGGLTERVADEVLKRLETARDLYARDPSRTLSVYNLADAELNVYRLFVHQGRHDEPQADLRLETARTLAEQLTAADPRRLAFAALLQNCLMEESGRALLRQDFVTAHAKAEAARRMAEQTFAEAPGRTEARYELITALMRQVRVCAADPSSNIPEELIARLRDALDGLSPDDRVFASFETLMRELGREP